jgi:hypothetical protein
MRPTMLAVIPLFAAIAASPATAQINARVHVDIPIGRDQSEVIYDQGYLPPELTVYDYDRNDYGDWDVDGYYQYWQPVTVYFYLGRYFERPIRGARPFVIYRYGNRYFFPPRDVRWEQRYGRNNNWGRRDNQYRGYGYTQNRGYLDQGVRGRNGQSQYNYNGSRNYPNQVPQGQYNGSRNNPNQVPQGQYNGSRNYPNQVPQGQYNGSRNSPNQVPQGQYNGGRNYPNQVPQGQYNGSRNSPNQVFRGQDQRTQNPARQVAPARDQRNQNPARQAAPGQDQRNQAARGQDVRRQNDRRTPDVRGGRSRP